MRFVPYNLHDRHGIIIVDYNWWHLNHYDVTDWMCDNLPRGENYFKGWAIEFESEQESLIFMLRWQA